MKYAVIQIRIGGAELLICEKDESGAVSRVLRERRPFALISYVQKKKLTPRGIKKLTEVIGEFKALCAEKGAEQIHAIALNSLKALKNTEEMLAELKDKCGLEFKPLSKLTSAHCDMLAAAEFAGKQGVLVIDSGGGSTQLVDMGAGADGGLFYMGLGAMKLSAKYIKNVLPAENEAGTIGARIKKKLDDKFFERKFERAVLIGAASYSIAKIYADYFDEKLDDGFIIGRKKLNDLLDFLINNPQKTTLILKNAPDRINTVIVNILIIKGILKRLELDEAIIRDYGITDGYMYGIINNSLPAEPEEKEAVKETAKPAKKTAKPDAKKSPVNPEANKAAAVKKAPAKPAAGARTKATKQPVTPKARATQTARAAKTQTAKKPPAK